MTPDSREATRMYDRAYILVLPCHTRPSNHRLRRLPPILRPQTHEIDNDHPVRLPQDVVGLIATVVASDTDEERRIKTLVNCIPVCRSFAHEFRPHLLKTFWISDCLVKGAEVVGKPLSTHAQALEDHPGHRAMVKAVTIQLENGHGYGRSVGNDPRVPSWLKELTSVASVSLGSRFNGSPLEFAGLRSGSRDAIAQLCSWSSIRRLTFDEVGDLPAQSQFSEPRISQSWEYCPEGREREVLNEAATLSPGIHLNTPHHTSRDDVSKIWSKPQVVSRVWKLSWRYDTAGEVICLNVSATLSGKTLRALELTISTTAIPNFMHKIAVEAPGSLSCPNGAIRLLVDVSALGLCALSRGRISASVFGSADQMPASPAPPPS
ncbi:hypothetical protein BKA70DRAFT_1239465 [Coprinopsis sp. MPI-PUGE-AT-0042]|nr:hypothetical protein BKA70DRAFT_1239465 [Coprinopsis sp. MPI-PUGE-AT-0042]